LISVYPEHSNKIHVVHHRADHLGHSPAERVETRPQTGGLLYVGTRYKYKNFDNVLRAMTAHEWPRDVKLNVVGPVATSTELHRISELGLQGRVVMRGRLTEQELRKAYRDSTAFIFPSLCEGFGFPILEAQLLNTAVVCSDIPVFREVGGKDTTLLFDPSDPHSIANAVARVQNETVRRELVARGRINASQYTWDRCAAERYAVFQQAMQ